MSDRLSWVPGRWYAPHGAVVGAETVPDTDGILAVPIYVPNGSPIDLVKLGVKGNPAVGVQKLRLGLAADADGKPGAFICEGDEIDLASTQSASKETDIADSGQEVHKWLLFMCSTATGQDAASAQLCTIENAQWPVNNGPGQEIGSLSSSSAINGGNGEDSGYVKWLDNPYGSYASLEEAYNAHSAAPWGGGITMWPMIAVKAA